MEKPQKTKEAQHESQKEGSIINTTSSRPPVWDCGSSLYDSFERKSFERQLDSAISSTRTLSMPHLTTSTRKQPQRQQEVQQPYFSKKSSKFSRSFHKLLRSLFRPKHQQQQQQSIPFRRSQDGFYVVYDTSGGLSSIPELPEMAPDYDYDCLSPEIMSSLVRRTASDRFTAASIAGISCA